MAVNIVLHRTLSLKCTGVNALSYPIHFNGSVLKLNEIGTTVKQKRVRCSDFQNILLQGLPYTCHLKNIKRYKRVGMPTEAFTCFNLAQNGHFIEHEWSDFYETFRNIIFDLRQIHNSYKIIKI